MGYIRLATHPGVFDAPLTPRAAIDNVSRLTTMPRCRVIAEPGDFLATYREIAIDVAARGNLVPGVHLAALLRVHDVRTIYTHDRDFRKFPFLKVIDPVA